MNGAPQCLWRRLGRVWARVSKHPVWATIIAALILSGMSAAGKHLHPLTLFGHDDAESAAAGSTWGPLRQVYRCDHDAFCAGGDHVSLDSTLNNPVYGDERYFLSGKVEGDVGGVRDLIKVEPGDVVQLRIFVANDGDPNIPHPRALLAQHLAVRLELPRDPDSQARIFAWLSARNAHPAAIFDSVTLESDEPFSVHLVGGSVKLTNRAHPNGLRLPDSIVEEAVLLGYRRPNGTLDTCFCHAGLVLAKVVIGG